MSFAFTPRLLLRPNVFHNVLKFNARSNSSGRPFVTPSNGDSFQPPELRKDNKWDIFQEFSNRNVAPKMTPDELWRERSKRHEVLGHPSIYAGWLVFFAIACDILFI